MSALVNSHQPRLFNHIVCDRIKQFLTVHLWLYDDLTGWSLTSAID
ncbi:hypothetical protein [Nostoc sp. MS1]|nr:hypothetical protein [Nostoc sp. MS1]